MPEGMPVVTEFDWVLSVTTEFDSMISYAHEVLGLTLTKPRALHNDRHFSRCSVAILPNRGTLAVVEPSQSADFLFDQQIACLAVHDFPNANQELERRGADFATEPVADSHGNAWRYLRAPNGAIYQVHGPTTVRGQCVAPSGDRVTPADSPLILGFDWLLSCTVAFEASVDFVEKILGLEVLRRGDAQNDAHFSRYALTVLPGGGTLEVVEPTAMGGRLRERQVLCLTVADFPKARRELLKRGAEFIGEVVNDGHGTAWIYLSAPGGHVYQVYGPWR